MIEVVGLSKRYGQVQALRDVTFTVEKGQIVGFLGANGAGKTTTMDIMCGCIGADSGTVKIAGFDITEEPIEAKKRLGYLPDVPPLHGEMRVAEYIAYSARLHKVPAAKIKSRVRETLERLSLIDVENRLVGNLSKGYRQRVALAQAIVHDPDVLVLDEPTEGLDPNQIIQIRELIRSLAGQHTIILSSHILSEVQNTCDHIIIVHNGTIVQQGTYEDLSHTMQQGKTYRLRVASNPDELALQLENIRGVITPRVLPDSDGCLEFALSKDAQDEVLDTIVARTVAGRHGLRELHQKTKSLEEVFFQLTK
jgi:ABC-2 type transport system ATP-binding protein